jgi:hypothetical protein
MRRFVAAVIVGLASVMSVASGALACSPPFEPPTIQALGPGQVVVLGMTGERVAGGRLFHVERWFNGGAPTTPILIAFQEGEPIGDCSYPMGAGRPLIIAPVMEPDGTLSANLTTLQADPSSPDGRRYLDEARRLFGPGIVPAAGSGSIAPLVAVDASPGLPAVLALLFGLSILIFGAVVLAHRLLRRPGRTTS